MELLTRAANILDTSEYEVLRRAYQAWHGHTAPESLLQQAFAHSLRHDELPPWARTYIKQVVHHFEAEYQRQRYLRRLRWLILAGPRRARRHRGDGHWPA